MASKAPSSSCFSWGGEGDMPQSTYHLSGKTERKVENITSNHFQSATAQEIEHIGTPSHHP